MSDGTIQLGKKALRADAIIVEAVNPGDVVRITDPGTLHPTLAQQEKIEAFFSDLAVPDVALKRYETLRTIALESVFADTISGRTLTQDTPMPHGDQMLLFAGRPAILLDMGSLDWDTEYGHSTGIRGVEGIVTLHHEITHGMQIEQAPIQPLAEKLATDARRETSAYLNEAFFLRELARQRGELDLFPSDGTIVLDLLAKTDGLQTYTQAHLGAYASSLCCLDTDHLARLLDPYDTANPGHQELTKQRLHLLLQP